MVKKREKEEQSRYTNLTRKKRESRYKRNAHKKIVIKINNNNRKHGNKIKKENPKK